MNPISHKLRTRRGLTLAEMLVAVAVLGLVAMAVAVGCSAGLRVYRQSVAVSDAQTLASTLSQALMDELRYAQEIRYGDDGTLTGYTSANYGHNASIGQDLEGHITVAGKPLVGSGSYAGLCAQVQVRYDETTACFDVELAILQTETRLGQANFSVRPLNGAARP